jgi:N utilization substance protein A
MIKYKPRTEFAAAISQIAAERNIDPEIVISSIREAVVAAYRRDAREHGQDISEEDQFEVEVDGQTGESKIFKMVEKKKQDVTPPGFGRIAAQTAKQVILQKIREAEKTAVLDEYFKRVGTLVSGMVLRFEGPNIIIDIGKAEAVMPPQEQVRSEGYHINQRLTFYLQGIQEGAKGRQIVVSRASNSLIERLFHREVPEVSQGTVEAKEIAREPGVRTKIAVVSRQAGVDPVGSCVGQKGVRVQEVISELLGEKIDVIQWNEDRASFIAAALSPAQNLKVEVNEKAKAALVIAPDDQLSLCIGKDGQNVRLAAKISGYKIDIRGESEAIQRKPAARLAKKTKRAPKIKTKNAKVANEKKESKNE